MQSSTFDERCERCAGDWNLADVRWLDHKSTARVAFCESPFGPAVLKLSLQTDMIAQENLALSYFGPAICPKVYAFSDELQALLLERVGDGRDLTAVYPNAETEVNAFLVLFDSVSAMGGTPAGFSALADWARIFDRLLGAGPSFNSKQIERLQDPSVRRVLSLASRHKHILSQGDLRLVHGDMHHYNILADVQGGWRLIDPHGLIGNPLYELGAFLRNPLPHSYKEPGMRERLKERANLLADRLRLPNETVAKYGFFGAAFSLAWDIEFEMYEEGIVRLSLALAEMAGL